MLNICYNYGMNLTQKPETLLVTRDGQLDEEYYSEIYAERRREALQAAGKEVLHIAIKTPIVVGKGIVYLFAHGLEQANQR